MKVGHINTLYELQLKMQGVIVHEGIRKILYEELPVYAYLSLDKQVGLTTVFSLGVSSSFI